MLPTILDIATLADGYRSGRFTPIDVIEAVIERRAAWPDKAAWITELADSELRKAAAALVAAGAARADQPLWGIPFAVKDNIDCAGVETTAACPAFGYQPEADAFVVARLKAAGAILVGKTNLDQFATGLNGTRSPYGAPRSVFDARYISGGSSSGSAVVVGSGQVSFALGTDTAGSGRIPAAFNNLVGVKPSRGLLSSTGMVPACRSLDCITVLAGTAGDADLVRRVAEGYDAADVYSRSMKAKPLPTRGLRFGVLAGAEREFYGDTEVEALYDAAIARLEALGGTAVPIDYAPFRECALLLYGGPWVAERLAAIEDFVGEHADAMDPTVRTIVQGANGKTAVDAFRGDYALEAYRQRTDAEWAKMDVLLLPTAPTTYTVEAMQADPITLNSNLGRYTNFVNLLDCSAIAIPAGFRADGIPGGVTLIGPAFVDSALAALADRLHRAESWGMGRDTDAALPAASALAVPTEGLIPIAVVGAHLSGMPLNGQLTTPRGTFIKSCRTSGDYRLYALPNTTPPKPGLIHAPGFGGKGLEVEIWALTPAAFGEFVNNIPAPLGVGKVTLDDGSVVTGFLCEPYAIEGAREITDLGGWRAYIAELKAQAPALQAG
ncbi:allophanate hydrolase [Kaistia dalseonensis]|uniref:Allophanate hydrolase n=1 Tax=Kaistia dalseonensis TaxID=410840 RepID=A0ABU0H874_9HYPH|nr:allophanate hydrolase [Kaistia dalseonensis]MCX5495879.1 allophanate hydrolase [Kaistia dalseonensis]MDQ0438480.1 allophanate hydrolase [Kaistia dalseonensis]